MMLSFYSRILVAYDGSDLSKKALDIALEFLQKDKRVELEVLSVTNTPSIAAVGSYGVYSPEIIKEAHENAKKMIEEVKTRLEGIPNKNRIDVLEGNPGKMIVDFAKQSDVDLIILGSRGLSNLQELFLGSVSHFVVQRSHCPVFVVK